MVYVLNRKGNPLMPTERHGKVRHLLKNGMAYVVKRCPFTIQLLYDTEDGVQPVTLGVDPGAKTIGLSASTETKELLSAEVALRDNIPALLARRKAMRQHRRYRKTRYRKARFLNRKIPKGWLPPSVRHKLDTHLQMIAKVHEILPISKIVVEVAAFDTQKMENPEIKGTEYQDGPQAEFWNTREYILYRDGHTCQLCKGKSKDPVLSVHHIVSRRIGGNAPSNLICLCESCHDMIHKKGIKLKSIRKRSYKDATMMNLVRKEIYNVLKAKYANVEATYGYITKGTRIANGLPKEHHIDALCIAGHPKALLAKERYIYKKVRCHNRMLHRIGFIKGSKRRKAQSGYELHGLQMNDVVRADGKLYRVTARAATGQIFLEDSEGNKKTKMIKGLTLIRHQRGYLIDRVHTNKKETAAVEAAA